MGVDVARHGVPTCTAPTPVCRLHKSEGTTGGREWEHSARRTRLRRKGGGSYGLESGGHGQSWFQQGGAGGPALLLTQTAPVSTGSNFSRHSSRAGTNQARAFVPPGGTSGISQTGLAGGCERMAWAGRLREQMKGFPGRAGGTPGASTQGHDQPQPLPVSHCQQQRLADAL